MLPSSRLLDQRARAALRRLEWRLRHRRVETPMVGEHRSIFRGRGMEFDQVVRYEFGDDVRDIDWNVTARLGEPYRKVFVEEREVTVLVIVNDDPALQFGSGAVTKREILFEVAGLALMLATINRERAALLHHAPDGATFYPPTRRRARILNAIAGLYRAPLPDPTTPFAGSPIPARPVPRGALIVWLGEVPAGSPPYEWTAIRRRHQVIGIRVEDEWEREGPALRDALAYDPASGDLVQLRDSAAARAAHATWYAEREKRWRAWWPDPDDRLVVSTTADPLAALIHFLRSRARTGPRAGASAA
ncbi:MAG: hypothetical protein JWN66_4026 [Sphingomonas bacterium]|uniref:DUF58 domain-containing protein n=1 Tax=Sphingomonas bacterium TaxID=1895847 RepID=UPI002604A86B|nr:DUF58 domain-containing protein [Sphingomonas bacterium]MDB5706910.1 hypothetical protein [Sphingomonas bacterium]